MSDARRHLLWLALVLVLATGLRLVRLEQRPLWYDEAFSLLLAARPPDALLAATLGEGVAAAEEHPPLYYLLLHRWMIWFGDTPATARALSALAGVVTVGLLYLLGRLLWDERAGLAAALVGAISPFAVYYSQEARMYALLGMALLAASYCFAWGWRRGGVWPWAGFALAGALALYTHNLAGLFVLALDLWLAWQWFGRRRRPRWRAIVAAHVVLLALYTPWLTVLPRQIGKLADAYWLSQPGLSAVVQSVFVFHFAADNQGLPAWLLPFALSFGLSILVLVLLEFARRDERATAPIDALPAREYVGVLAFGPVVLAFLISLVRPIFVMRAFLPAALIYYLLVGRFFVAGRPPRLIRAVVASGSAAVVVASLAFHYQYGAFPRAPFAAVAAHLDAAAAPGDAIVHSNKLSYLPLHYLRPDLPQAFLADPPGSESDTLSPETQAILGIAETVELDQAVGEAPRVWLIVYDRALAAARRAGLTRHPDVAWLADRYERRTDHRFGDLMVLEFAGPVEAGP